MLIVDEVFPDGHDRLTQSHLDYVREMANCIGFTVLDEAGRLYPSEALIRLHISMDNPLFWARVEEAPGSSVD